MRALVSTSDKSGLLDFINSLSKVVSEGLEIVSTGGTYEYLKKNNINVTDISEVTQFPEVLDGRVKTLHPFVHMGLLADKSKPDHLETLQKYNVKAFDIVIGNLYPFEQVALRSDVTYDELIENIDIGGPSFLRSSAKNYKSVIVISSPSDYSWVQEKLMNGTFSIDDRKKLALKVFSLTSYYDALIVQKLSNNQDDLEYLNLPLRRQQKLRYGENPQQSADWYTQTLPAQFSLSEARIHQGKELSYNNLLDLEASTYLVRQLKSNACVAVKHNNPCGVACSNSLLDAVQKTIQSDSKSIFGGIIALNQTVDLKTAEFLKNIFLECIIAPAYDEDALAAFSTKKNLRILSWPKLLQQIDSISPVDQYKSVSGGFLRQEADTHNFESWNYLTTKPPHSLQLSMQFGELVCASLKSNAIAIVYQQQTIGLGMGQVNRVDAVQQALQRMIEFKKSTSIEMKDVILVSDAFFPFADSIDYIAAAGIEWILQPGGSVQDAAVISAAEKNKINMVLTNRRHFKH